MGWLKKEKAKIQEQPVEASAAEVKALESKAEEKYDEIIVVKELPTVQMHFAKLQNGKTAKLITVEEALTEILNAD